MTIMYATSYMTGNGSATVEPEVGAEDYNWGVLCLTPIVLFGITGNVFVCMAISMEKRLQTVTNYFLLSLAITDLLVCIIVMPMSIINDFLGYWLFSTTTCNVYITADVLMSTSSILHLCSISVQRYLAISRPLKWRNRSRSVVVIKIGFIWIAAFVISSPVTILGLLDRSNILNDRQCRLSNEDFIIYGSILAFFIPLVIMVITYTLTARLLYNKAKLCDPNRHVGEKEGRPIIRRSKSTKVKRASSMNCGTGRSNSYDNYRKERMNNNSKADDIYRSIPSIISHSSSCGAISETAMAEQTRSPSHLNADIKIKESRSCFLEVPKPSVFDSSTESLATSDLEGDISEEEESRSFSMSFMHDPRSASPDKASLRSVIICKASSFLNLALRDKHNDKSTVRTEQKASKVLGLVFAIFLLCWLPFFISNILPVVCKSCTVKPVVMSTFAWLGWASSTINPIIYTMFNKTFKMAFMKFICCRYRVTRHLRSTSMDTKKYNESVLNRISICERDNSS